MVTCKYFLQGNCRFGNNCKFDHSIGDNTRGYASVLRQQNPTNAPNVDINMLVQSVSNDMQAAEKGGQWLFSCYAPFKEKSCFPGFEDKSFEEVRLAYYEAQRNGTLDQYKQQLQMLLQDVMMKTRALQNPSADVVNIIKNIYNSPPSSSSSSSSSNSFGTSAFGATQNSPFGASRPLQTGSNKHPSQIFVSNQPVLSQNAPQGCGSSQSTTSSIFAQANQKLFGNSNVQQQGSIFGGGGGVQQSSSFGQGQTNPSQNLFRGNLTSQPFSNTPTFAQNSSPFAAGSPFQTQSVVATSSPFQQQQQQPFGGQNFAPNQFQNAPTTFGNQATFNAPNQSIFTPQVQNQTQNQQQMFSGQQINANQRQGPFSAQNQPQIGNQNQSSIFGNVGGSAADKGIINSASVPFSSAAPAQFQNSQSHSSNIFGSNFGSTQASVVENKRDESFYSKPEDLTEEEKKSFENNEFEFGKIPEKPPTLSLCF